MSGTYYLAEVADTKTYYLKTSNGRVNVTASNGVVTEASKTVAGDDGFDRASEVSKSDVPDEVQQKLQKGVDNLL